ncbi:MAG TPA: hypothetical protein DD670_12120 [Planctomycetaceae bacterium]|nr:hypothetical protein [Planctomycetaceae bacterium]
MIEQAIFTSAETDRLAGYQVVAASPGASVADQRELAIWGPSHGSLIDLGPDGVSFNFHPLPSGAYCVSRTTMAGGEYSGRGRQVYTQCLIVPSDELARFANNPFDVLRAAMAGGSLEVQQQIPRQLEPMRLFGHTAAVDSALLARLSSRPGAPWLARLVQAALSCPSLAIAGAVEPEHLIAGLLNCLPPECRTQFSFSTGLRYSPRRPFRITTLADDPAELRQTQRRQGTTVLDASNPNLAEFAPIDGWPRLIEHVLKSGKVSFLASQFSKRRFELTPDDLPALALQLMEEFDASALPSKKRDDASARRKSAESAKPGDWLDGLQQAHAAHRRFRGSATLSTPSAQKPTGPAHQLSTNCPEVLERLEQVDDLVFEAIDGNAEALAKLRETWPKLHEELAEPLMAESREQYLRHALFIWQGSVTQSGVHDPARAVHALEVLSILFDETP